MLIRENTAEISTKYLTAVKSHAELSQIRVSDQEWLDHLPGVLSDLVEMLESPPTETSERTMRSASQHGRVRRDQGYSVPMMIEEARIVSDVVFEIIQRNLMALDLSRLIADVRCMNDSLQAQLTASVAAYLTRNHLGKSCQKSQPLPRRADSTDTTLAAVANITQLLLVYPTIIL